MAVRTNNNRTYYINPTTINFVENPGLGDPNLIQVTISVNCYISVYDPEYDITYDQYTRNYQNWRLTGYNNQFPDNAAYFIYARLERTGDRGLIVYDKRDRLPDGKLADGTSTEADPTYYYIKLGKVSATDGTKLRVVSYDTGYLQSDKAKDESSTALDEMFELDKTDSSNWLIKVKHAFKDFIVNGMAVFKSGFSFRKIVTSATGSQEVEKKVTDIHRSTDADLAASDTILPTTSKLKKDLDSLANIYLSKIQEDTAGEKITFNKGLASKGVLTVGESGFTPGIAGGAGAQIDAQGNAEMESLILRRFLEVPELRYNRVEVMVGDKWRAPGGGKIATVDTGTQTCTLKLEDGEIGAIAVGDICMGIYHAEDGNLNATADDEDKEGNRTFAGFCTVYFDIKSVSNDKKSFTYGLRGGKWNVHPFEMMNFVAYGNFTDLERQTSVYETRTYTRMLVHQNGWVIKPENIALQYGDMSNIPALENEAKKYSLYTGNVYMHGILKQVKENGTPVLSANDRGEWKEFASDGVTRVRYDYYDRVSHVGCLWLCTNEDENGTYAEPAEEPGNPWLLQVRAGDSVVSFEDWDITKVPYPANSIIGFGNAVVISKVKTSQSPFPLLTDYEGNLLKTEQGYIIANDEISEDWTLLLKAPDVSDGESSITADLDNEMDSIPLNYLGVTTEKHEVKTRARMWYGTHEMSIKSVSVSEAAFAQVTTDETTGEVTITVEAETEVPERSVFKILVLGELNGIVEHRELSFTLAGVKAGSKGENAIIHQLQVTENVISKRADGSLSIETISACRMEIEGKNRRKTTLGKLCYYFNDATNQTQIENDETVPVSGTYDITFVFYDTDNTIIDKETIPLIKDGQDAVFADLDNEMDSVPLDSSGVTLKEETLTTTLGMWSGSTKLKLSSLDVDINGKDFIKDKEATAKTGLVTLVIASDQPVPEKSEFVITATALADGVTVTRKLKYTLIGVKAGANGEPAVTYRVIPSVSSIVRKKDGTMSPATISVQVFKTVGDVTTKLTTEDIEYVIDGKETNTVQISNVNINTERIKDNIEFSFYRMEGKTSVLKDSETVRVVSDGMDNVSYDLVPSIYSIKKDKNDMISPKRMTCALRITDGNEVTLIDAIKKADGVNNQYNALAEWLEANPNFQILIYGINHTYREGPQTWDVWGDAANNNVYTGQELLLNDFEGSTEGSLTAGITEVKCIIQKDGIEIRRVDLPIIPDGKDGADSVMPRVIDLDNEMDSVALDKDGKLSSAVILETKVHIWDNGKELKLSNIVTSGFEGIASVIDTTASTGEISITLRTDVEIQKRSVLHIKAYWTSTSYMETNFVLTGVRDGADGNPGERYQIIPSTNSIVRKKDGTISPTTISVQVFKTVGDVTTKLTMEDIDYEIDNKGVNTVAISSININTSDIADNIKFSFYRTEGNVPVLKDAETVRVVSDGDKGDKGVVGAWTYASPLPKNSVLFCLTTEYDYDYVDKKEFSGDMEALSRVKKNDIIIVSFPCSDDGNVYVGYMLVTGNIDGILYLKPLSYYITKKGLQGCIIRTSKWTPQTLDENGNRIIVEYWNQSDDAKFGNLQTRFIDVVTIENDNTTSGWDVFQCIAPEGSVDNSDAHNPKTDGTNWQEITNAGPIYTSLILAKNAKIEIAQTNSILVEGTCYDNPNLDPPYAKLVDGVCSGMTGTERGVNATRLWVGANFEYKGHAPFRVNAGGEMWATNAHIKGNITATDSYLSYNKYNAEGCIISPALLGARIEDNELKTIYLPRLEKGYFKTITTLSPISLIGIAQRFSGIDSTVRLIGDLRKWNTTYSSIYMGQYAFSSFLICGFSENANTYWYFIPNNKAAEQALETAEYTQ